MENLLALLSKIQQLSPLPVFSPDVIIVQNPGMQHWLNLSLAKERGISMNIRYALPSQFLWKLIRTLADDDVVPEQELFSREVLTWKIYQLLASKQVTSDADFSLATQYWQAEIVNGEQASQNTSKQANKAGKEANLKRYQLAAELADLYEQYLIFRPEWIDNWQAGNFDFCARQDNAENESDSTSSKGESRQSNSDIEQQMLWQGKLWQLLTAELSYNPIIFVKNAINNLADKAELLPKRISFFGINAMAPLWLEFINALSEHTQVHFFHLNPCYAYWGDVLTEKQAIKSIDAWVKDIELDEAIDQVTGLDISDSEENAIEAQLAAIVGNPLLANLGQQGREFMALLHQYSTINIEAFEAMASIESETSGQENNHQVALLNHIQHDILSLEDKRISSAQGLQTLRQNLVDDSITITSCHSALREVQGFHDWLLNQFNQDPSLTPKDVLVMCPQIEQYAPYVNAVFTHGWQDIDDKVPPLPCSIADRVTKDAEPMVVAFMQLLSLPDSRFQVSELLAYLRLPALQTKFDINNAELEKISLWLEHASVHWGLDQHHKSKMLLDTAVNDQNNELTASMQFTWQAGLSRLLRGFAFGDQVCLYQEQALLPDVEGDDAVLLGKLMLIIEQLADFANDLNSAKTANEWQSVLTELLESLFETGEERIFENIYKAIGQLTEYCQLAGFNDRIELLIVKDFLNNHFSQPDPGRHFLIGQVTFCSMLPMRSIPFKVIAILGLNDGEFPRQRQPLGFDLMAHTPVKLGDRSRRGDDRYMFLEAIISARKALYLSYQGRSIRTDQEKQPSIVLKELMDYLSLGYGWQCDIQQNNCNIRQLPMQPFSLNNYIVQPDNINANAITSFDPKWLALALSTEQKVEQLSPAEPQAQDDYTLSEQSANNLDDLNPATWPKVNLSAQTEQASNVKVANQQVIALSELIRFYQHPIKTYAQRQLQLHFEDNQVQLDDIEPFDFSSLESYLFRQEILSLELANEADNTESNAQETTVSSEDSTEHSTEHSIGQAIKLAQLQGKFPELPHTEKVLEKWQQTSHEFAQYIDQQNAAQIETVSVGLTFNLQFSAENHVKQPVTSEQVVQLSTKLPVSGQRLVMHRSSSAKAKDLFSLYVNQLILQVWQQQQEQYSQDTGVNDNEALTSLLAVCESHGFYFDTKSQKIAHYFYGEIEQPEFKLCQLLAGYFAGIKQPLLLNVDIAQKCIASPNNKQSKKLESAEQKQQVFQQLWQDENSFNPLGKDPYIAYFFEKCPQFADIESALLSTYQSFLDDYQQVKTS